MMRYLHKLPILIFTLGPFGLGPLAGQTEEIVAIQYRTYGWNSAIQEHDFKSENQNVTVFAGQFSKKQIYTGPRLMRFYDSNTGAQIAEGLLPQSMDKLLLVFTTSPPEAKLPFRVFFVDDSLTKLHSQNVHFYNLSSTELVVKTLDRVQKVAPSQQSLWDLEPADKISSIAIAVTDPLAKIIYSTRYRILANQRLIFFARMRGYNPDGTPKLEISYVIEKILLPTN